MSWLTFAFVFVFYQEILLHAALNDYQSPRRFLLLLASCHDANRSILEPLLNCFIQIKCWIFFSGFGFNYSVSNILRDDNGHIHGSDFCPSYKKF